MTPIPCEKIFLDATLHDLYAPDLGKDEEVTLFYFNYTEALALKYGISKPRRFIYQYGSAVIEDEAFVIGLYLQQYPLHMTFFAGKMPVYMMDVNDDAGYKEDVLRVFAHLTTDQQPRVSFFKGPAEPICSPGERVAVLNPTDSLLELPHLVNPDVQFLLQCKRTLAFSGLPTPATEVIDTHLQPLEVQDEAVISREVQLILNRVHQRKLPFVLKLQQSAGSLGTFFFRSEKDRQRWIPEVEVELRRALRQLNSSNQIFHPASLVIQSFVSGDTVAIAMFIPKQGDPVFLGGSAQFLNDQEQWIGGSISYREQDSISENYSPIMRQVARFVQQHGYHGPFCMDLMTDSNGNHLVIDLNPRCPAGAALGVLRTHFSRQRNLDEAALIMPLCVSGTRDRFEKEFSEQCLEGRLVITSWCYLRGSNRSMAGVIFAAETKEKLRAFITILEDYQARVE
ncbi:hypothetical protein N7466_007203 [Penicillium verhagenii]|uniref:uncharacterized protein n=1 Tax=Penicillium verhagenii TaxID=1562060 RepID=UPI0025455A14|nr:uncharacterized protein N7466_007203 [Penicillium verhagenii]KAJ5928247.1 hypothetical protein N7466_007203 [Penicillium verhagenii]